MPAILSILTENKKSESRTPPKEVEKEEAPQKKGKKKRKKVSHEGRKKKAPAQVQDPMETLGPEIGEHFIGKLIKLIYICIGKVTQQLIRSCTVRDFMHDTPVCLLLFHLLQFCLLSFRLLNTLAFLFRSSCF